MEREQIQAIVKKQREFFGTGTPLSIGVRQKALEDLKKGIRENEEKIAKAIKADLGKSREYGGGETKCLPRQWARK